MGNCSAAGVSPPRPMQQSRKVYPKMFVLATRCAIREGPTKESKRLMRVFKYELVKSTGKEHISGQDVWLQVVCTGIGSGLGWALAKTSEATFLVRENSREAERARRGQEIIKYRVLSDRSIIREEHNKESPQLLRIHKDDIVTSTGQTHTENNCIWIEVLCSLSDSGKGWVLAKDEETLLLAEEDSPAALSTMDDSLNVNEMNLNSPDDAPLTPTLPTISLSGATSSSPTGSSTSDRLGVTEPVRQRPPSSVPPPAYSSYVFPSEEEPPSLTNQRVFDSATLLRLSEQGTHPLAPPFSNPASPRRASFGVAGSSPFGNSMMNILQRQGATPVAPPFSNPASPRRASLGVAGSNPFGNSTMNRLHQQGAMPVAPPLSPDTSLIQIPRPPSGFPRMPSSGRIQIQNVESEPASLLQTEYTGSGSPSPTGMSPGFSQATLQRLIDHGVSPNAPPSPGEEPQTPQNRLVSENAFGNATLERLFEHGVAPAAPPALTTSTSHFPARRHATRNARFSVVSTDAPTSNRSSIVRDGPAYMDLHLDLGIDDDIFGAFNTSVRVPG